MTTLQTVIDLYEAEKRKTPDLEPGDVLLIGWEDGVGRGVEVRFKNAEQRAKGRNRSQAEAELPAFLAAFPEGYGQRIGWCSGAGYIMHAWRCGDRMTLCGLADHYDVRSKQVEAACARCKAAIESLTAGDAPALGGKLGHDTDRNQT